MAIRTLSVCSGIGGLDLGLKFADSRIRTICYVEREAYAAAVLVGRMDAQALDSAPIWDDFTTLRGEDFCGRVDLVVGGIPCQPYSAAGKGLCENDERDLWGTMSRFLRESGHPALFLENVAAFIPRAMDRVLWDLAEMGYSAKWGVFSNESLGAPHQRKRLFLLAYTERFLLRLQQGRGGGESGQGAAVPGFVRAESSGLEEGCRESQFSRPANRNLPFWPPGQDPELWKEWPEHFWPSAERSLCGAPDGVLSWLEFADQYRTDRLRALGNAVSPPVAAVAWRVLTDRAEKRG